MFSGPAPFSTEEMSLNLTTDLVNFEEEYKISNRLNSKDSAKARKLESALTDTSVL